MSLIPAKELISIFQKMYTEHWAYRIGAAERGCVDCSGAFVYAYRQCGKRIAHGSNSIGRKYVLNLLPISEAEPGMAAFKLRNWTEDQRGNAWFGKEPGDLYHIGLIDSDPAYVLNAKGTKSGFSRDKVASWHFVAYLTDVSYDGGEIKMGIVVLPSGTKGSTVNMRSKPQAGAPLIMRVPVGSTVEIVSDLGEWCNIRYNGKTGYMMSNFVEYDTEGQESETDAGETVTISAADVEEIGRALSEIEAAVDAIGAIIGRG